MVTSSQKFIARNRAPRVQIEYDVELYGAEKKIQLPFIMGVLSLSVPGGGETDTSVGFGQAVGAQGYVTRVTHISLALGQNPPVQVGDDRGRLALGYQIPVSYTHLTLPTSDLV